MNVKIGPILDGGGWRALCREVAERHRNNPIGFEYAHSMVDDHFLLAYSEILPNEKGTACAAILVRAVAHFAPTAFP